MRYSVTFACYGTHLHGDERGSVDRHHNNAFGNRFEEPNQQRGLTERLRMKEPAYEMNHSTRAEVLKTLQEVCRYRAWNLLAAHVRSNHVHVVLEGEGRPENMLKDLKAYASRALNALDGKVRRRWARHGSTRWLWNDAQVSAAVRYVIEEQGAPMAVFVATDGG